MSIHHHESTQPLLQGIDAVLFDFDGTLIDASEVIIRSFNETLRDRGDQPLTRSRLRSMIGRPLREMFQDAIPGASEETLDWCVDEYRRVFGPLAVPLSRPLPSVPQTIEWLARSGVRLAVVTTRTADSADVILRGHGLREPFAAVIGLEHVTHPKPHPEPVEIALERLGVPPARAVMVGDTPDDIEAGKAAGTRTVGVTSGVYDAASLREAGADLVVTELGAAFPG